MFSMKNIINNCDKNHSVNLLVMPSKEDFEIALCKTGSNIYRVNLGTKWDESKERPDNHFILPEASINNIITYDFLIIPNQHYPQEILSKIVQYIQTKVIRVVPDAPEHVSGAAKDFDTYDDKFVEYWNKIILNNME